MDTGKTIKYVILGIIALVLLSTMGKLFETVDRGTYQIKQAAITGTMSAKMDPGIWTQMFGDIQVWPKAETFYFTADAEEGAGRDQSIEVRFADGSVSHISGTMRVLLPASAQQAVDLSVKFGYRSYEDLAQKLIMPVVRNALTLTANMMTARESYAERRNDYVFWTWDQIQNGIYETTEESREIVENGEKMQKVFKVIKRDATGKPIYQINPLKDTGLQLANFEIKKIVYPETVEKQIGSQQEAYMAVATKKAEVQKAEQEKLKLIAEGQAAVAKSQYEMEVKKVQAVVEANQRLEVAKLDKESAALKKAKDILEGEGEAEKRRLIMSADGALEKKLAAFVEVQKTYAVEFGKQRWVPEVMMGGSGADVNKAAQMIDLLTTQAARALALDVSPSAKK